MTTLRNKINLRSTALAAFSAVLAFGLCAVAADAQAPAPAAKPTPPVLLAAGQVAPDFTVQDPTGKDVHLSDYAGKVIVVDFWATWCPPCQASMPHTNSVAEAFKSQDVEFLGVNVADTKDAFEKWLPTHKQYDAINFVIDQSPRGKSFVNSSYGVTGIPTQFVIDKSGKVVTSFVGYGGPNDDLKDAIQKALAAPAPTPATPSAAPTQ